MKKVLIITYDFPPRGGVAVIRITKFVKYLPQFGWQPIVLTITSHNPEMNDESLVEEIRAFTQIFRLPSLIPKSILNKYRDNILKAKVDDSVGYTNKSSLKKYLKNLYLLLEHFFLIPDNRIFWIPLAIIKGYQIAQQQKIDVILTTSPPHSTQIAGYILKKVTKIPWCSDYRDEWIGNPCFSQKFFFREKIEQKMEKHFVSTSNYVIANTALNKSNFIKKYPNLSNKFHVITNGFDSDDFKNVKIKKQLNQLFTISYIGSISIKQKATTFLAAFSKLIHENPDLKNKIKIIFAGPFLSTHKNQLKEYEILDNVEIRGNVPYKEGLQIMLESDALLLLLDPEKGANGIVPAKTYEYLKIGKPILAVIPEGSAVGKFIKKYGQAVISDFNDVKSIQAGIVESMKIRNQTFDVDKSLDKFERKNLTLHLVSILNKLV